MCGSNKIEKVFIVFKTHFDIGFTELAEEIVRHYRSKMLADVVETCDATMSPGKDRRFVWTMAAWPLAKSLEPVNELVKKACELILEGRVA